MSDGRLPERIDPIRLAEGRRRLRGALELSALSRLRPYLADERGQVDVEIAGGIDEDGTRFLRGRLTTTLTLVCQRCLESFKLPIESEFLLGVVTHETFAETLPEPYEPLVVGDEPISLKEIVEDELILALPIVPKHPDGECPGDREERGRDEEPAAGQRENPFAALEKLKTNRKS